MTDDQEIPDGLLLCQFEFLYLAFLVFRFEPDLEIGCAAAVLLAVEGVLQGDVREQILKCQTGTLRGPRGLWRSVPSSEGRCETVRLSRLIAFALPAYSRARVWSPVCRARIAMFLYVVAIRFLLPVRVLMASDSW